MPDKNRKLIDEFKALGAPAAMPSPRATKVSQFENDYREMLAREQAEREQAVKAGLTSWVTEIPGFVADLAVDAPYYLGQRAMGRRGDAIRPLGYGERVRAELATALGLQNPPSDEVGMRPPPANENITDLISLANPLAWSIAGDPIGLSKIGSKAFKSVGKGLGREAGRRIDDAMMTGEGMLGKALSPARPAFVVKPKGGNWVDSPSRTLSDGLGSLKYNTMNAFPEEAAIDKWIDTKLERYIKNEMASPDDPVRAYLEAFPARKQAMLEDKQRQIDKAVADMERARDARGVSPEMLTRSQERIRDLEKEKALIEERQGLHFEPRLRFSEARVAQHRQEAGFPREGMATGRQAKSWERESDAALAVRSAGQFIARNPTQYEIRGRNPTNAWNTVKHSLQEAEAELESLRAAREKLDPRYAPNSPIAAGMRERLDDILSTPNPTPVGPLVDNPFIAKLPRQTPLYGLKRDIGRFGDDDLGLTHLTAELRNAMRAGEQGLPESLALRPKDLDKMTVPQVIEHVDKINAWRAAQKNEVNAAIANNPATMLHKEYATIPGTDLPNTRGLRWVELTSPNKLPENFSVSEQNGRFNVVDTATGDPLLLGRGQTLASFKTPEEAVSAYYKQNPKELQDALRHEGELMAHCVGGYCQDVTSGSSRIFSLRDAKHKPYTTIEVKPTQHLDYNKWFENQPEEIQNRIAQRRIEDKNHDIYEGPEYLAARAELPQTVTQVKAYRDRKPDDEYIPFVQDFIRSNKFPITGDRPNTDLVSKSGLVKVSPDGSIVPEFTPAQLEALGDSEYLTLSELQKLRATPAAQPADAAPNLLPPVDDMKKGGAVKRSGPASQDAMQMQVWDKALRRQTGGSSEPTQAEIEAAMRPETISPRLRALANRVKTQPGVPITDRLVGAGEAATSLASGILGSIPAGYEGMAELLRSRDPARAAQAVETGLQRYTYQPRTAIGMQEAQAGAHLLEKLDAPSQYVGNYMLEQTGSPAAATAAQIILDPLNFLPGPKQLASTVRGVPRMLQDAAIQAYGPGATASHVVPPQGNLNLTPHASAELLKGPDRQPVGNFLTQLQGTPGVTKAGLKEGLAATRVLDPTSVVTKAEFEKYATPSKYEKFDLIDHDDVNADRLEHFIDLANMRVQEYVPFEYLGHEMGVSSRYAEDFNALVQQTNMPHFADATRLSELEAYGIPRELITQLADQNVVTTRDFDLAIDDLTRNTVEDLAHRLLQEDELEHGSSASFSNTQRLVDKDSRAALPSTAYQEIGVTHPNQQGDYRHFPGQRNMVGHFRGTMVPADWRRGVELENGAGTIPPGAFLIEELQSDAQQSGDTTKHLHQVHGVVAKAAIQHALEQGAHTVYIPTSSAIIDVREGLSNIDKDTLRRVYDKEVPSQAIEPLRKIPGVTITTTNPTASTNPKDRKFMFHVITFTDAAREHILRGLGQRTPGYAKGGPVSRDAMQMQVWDRALQRQTGGSLEPTQAEIEAAMRPETISPHIRAFSNKLKANVTPPESVMDPRYAPWKKNLDQAEAFNIAADIVLSAAPLVGPALSLGRKAATSIGRQAGEALNTRILSGQGMVPGMPDMFAPNPLAFVVKPKGGNMLPDAVEAATAGLRRPVPSRATDNYGNEVPNPLANTDTAIENMALNNFIDTKINRYIKNEMATPEDPVRALAERGILHFEPNIADAPWLYENPATLARRRAAAGYPKEGLAQTPLGRSWETLTDQSLKSRPVSSIIASLEKRKLPVSDWMAKLEPTTPFYDPEIYNDALGLTHVMDELRNAMNPLAGLPRELMLKPETLSKLTLPQAIERVADINAWRLKQSETAIIADTLKADVHKEYRDTGTSWVKLNKPGQFAAESDAMGHSVRGYEPPKNGGDPSYGHGGWNAIKSGRAEVYSLRDAKKQPQVTIEVMRDDIDPLFDLDDPYAIMDAVYDKAPASKHAAFARWIEAHAEDHNLEWHILASPWAKYLPQTQDARLYITQIKGKGNGQPKPEYLPMIQDFIRSGQWDGISDLRNAGLQQLPDKRLLTLEEFNAGLARLKKSRTVSTNDKNYASDAAGFNYRVDSDASSSAPGFWDRVKHFWDTPAEPVKTVKPIKRAKGGPVSRDAMQMQVWDKALQRQTGGASEPTQAEIEAAMRPETTSPRFKALATKVKARGERDLPLFQAPGELAATLLTGAVAQPVAAALGPLLTGIPGIEGVNQAISNMTYMPRTLPGQKAVELASHAMETAKIPPFVPVLGPLGALQRRPGMAQHIAQGAKDAVLQAALDAYGPGATASYVTKPLDQSKRKFIGLREVAAKPLAELKPNDLKNISALEYLTSKILNSSVDRRKFMEQTGKALSSFTMRKMLPDLKLFGSKATALSTADLDALKGYALIVDRIEDAIDEGSFTPSRWTASEIIKDVLSNPEHYEIENASPAVLKKISSLIEQHGFVQEGNAALPLVAEAPAPTPLVPKDIQTAYRDTLKVLREEGYHNDLYDDAEIANVFLENPGYFGVEEAQAPHVAKLIAQYGRSKYENPILGTSSTPLSSAQEMELKALFSPVVSDVLQESAPQALSSPIPSGVITTAPAIGPALNEFVEPYSFEKLNFNPEYLKGTVQQNLSELPVPKDKPKPHKKGGPISRDAMWMAVQDKQLRKKHGN